MENTEILRRRSYRNSAEWQSIILEQSSSGERAEETCARHGISLDSFHRHRRELSGKKKSVPGSFTELEVSVVNECEIRCRNGRTIIVRGAVSPAHLKSILLVVEQASS